MGLVLVIDYVDDVFGCVLDYSYDLDLILEENAATASDDPQITALHQEYSDCITEVKQAEPELMVLANIYQRQYLKRENTCVNHFDKQTSDYLNSDRSENDDLQSYYNIWENYSVCDYSVYLLSDLEPVTYLSKGWPQYFLDFKQQRVHCADQMLAAEEAADRNGIRYDNNPAHFLQITENFNQCEVQALRSKTEYEVTNNLIDNLRHDDDFNSYIDYDYEEIEAYEKQQQLTELNEAIEMIQITPAQVEANNFYYYQYLTLNQISAYDVTQKKFNSVYSFDYVSPSSYTSIQLPLGIDFKQGKMILDPSALLPLVALSIPESAPLPEDMTTTTVAFGLPEEIQKSFSSEVIYDALISAIAYSLTELDSSNFTMTDFSQDDFAKQLGARTVVKVNLDAYQSGKMLGVIFKHMINTLQTHVEAHPEAYQDPDDIAQRLENIQALSTTFLTDDAGRMLQTLETFLPITFNKINRFYLDADNQLLGKQVSMAIGSDLAGRTHNSITQTRYDAKSFEQNSLEPLFIQSFGMPFSENSNLKPLDGNEWLQNTKNRQKLLIQAEYARSSYGRYNPETEHFEEYDEPDSFNNDQPEKIDGMDNMDYEPKISIVESGNVNDPEYQDKHP